MQQFTNDQIIQERKEFCSKLRDARKAQGLTLEQVASALQMDRTTLNKHENGKTPVGIDTIIKLCRFYKISLTI